MHSFQRKIHLSDTDATGVIYFAKMQNIALEAFEDYLSSVSLDLSNIIREQKFLFPVVHVDANYMEPIFVGNKVEARLNLKKVGISSFTLFTEIHKNQSIVGTVQITHVTIDFASKKSVNIPNDLKRHLQKLS